MTNNQSSYQSPYTECRDYQECEKVARGKWWDAVTLFEAERYSSTLYMAGYVIEIGIKAEFLRLANQRVTFSGRELLQKMEHVHKGERLTLDAQVEQWLTQYPDPPTTLKELLLFLRKTESFFTRTNNTEGKFQSTYKCPAYSVIVENRSPEPKGPEREGGALHNTKGFLRQLLKWKRLLNQPVYNSVRQPVADPESYILPDWNTDMRYSNHNTSEEDALKAIKTSLSFLKEVLTEIRPEKVREMGEKLDELTPLTMNFQDSQTTPQGTASTNLPVNINE